MSHTPTTQATKKISSSKFVLTGRLCSSSSFGIDDPRIISFGGNFLEPLGTIRNCERTQTTSENLKCLTPGHYESLRNIYFHDGSFLYDLPVRRDKVDFCNVRFSMRWCLGRQVG